MKPAAPWWQHPALLARWSRDLLMGEMMQLRPCGWAWPVINAHHDMHLVHDAGADSLELMALSSAWAERLDLQTEEEWHALSRLPSWRGWQEAAEVRWRRGDALMRFATSGSTGRPKVVAHPMTDLHQEVHAFVQRILLDGPPIERIVSTVRAHHLYGFLFTVLLPLALGAQGPQSEQNMRAAGAALPVLDVVHENPLRVRTLLQPGDLVVAFPDWWDLALRSGTAFPPSVMGICSTAPCPPAVGRAALSSGLVRWLEVYGSTETAGVGWRACPDEPFELLPHWQRVDAPEEAEPDLAQDVAGDVVEDVAAEGARAAPQTRIQRIGVEGSSRAPSPAPDHLEWTGPRHFRPTERRDGVVQVGGVNVDPAQVASRLCGHPGVAEAAVRLHQPDGAAAARLKAFVVPRAGHASEALATELADWCRRQFIPAARPVHIRCGPALPRNEMGKPCDWDVPGQSFSA